MSKQEIDKIMKKRIIEPEHNTLSKVEEDELADSIMRQGMLSETDVMIVELMLKLKELGKDKKYLEEKIEPLIKMGEEMVRSGNYDNVKEMCEAVYKLSRE